MNADGFIRLPQGGNGGGRGGPPPGGNNARRSSVPPPPPPVGAGRGGPGPGVQRVVQPNQGQPMMNPQVVPAPQRNQIPPRYLQRPPVEICDIRRERMSESDIRDLLSDFTVIRFEKIVDEENRDDRDDRHGRYRKPNGDWKTVVRTNVPGSKEEIMRQIRRLDNSKKRKTALDKKKELTLDQQRQIEKAQEDLATFEMDPRYHIILAQIDQTLKPVDRHYHHDSRHYSHRSSHHRRHSSHGNLFLRSKSRDARDRGHSKDGKRKMQRVSVTAYYKRCPRPDANPMLLLREREQMENTPPWNQQQFLQQQHMQQQQQQQRMQQQQQPPFQQGQGYNQQRPPPQGQQRQGVPPPRVMGNPQQRMPPPRRPRAASSASSSDSSDWSSDEDFWSAGEGSRTTRTDSSSSQKRGRPGSRQDKRYLEHRPSHFGVRPNAAIRHHSRHEDNYPLPFAPVPPRAPALIEADIEHAKAQAFAAGRHEGRHEGRQEEKLENRLANEEAAAIAAAYRPRLAPPPRVIQPDRRSSVRLVDPRDLGYDPEEEALDRFARLDLADRRRDDLEAALSHRREYERRLREGDMLEREERGRMRERDAMDYMSRRASSPGSPMFSNPFTPRPMRRNTVQYETRGRYYP